MKTKAAVVYEPGKRLEIEELDLDLVFLGDVFDLLRTERWFVSPSGQPVPVEERPWGSAEVLDDPHAAYTQLLVSSILPA